MFVPFAKAGKDLLPAAAPANAIKLRREIKGFDKNTGSFALLEGLGPYCVKVMMVQRYKIPRLGNVTPILCTAPVMGRDNAVA